MMLTVILCALALISTVCTHLLLKMYTSPWNILTFIGMFIGCFVFYVALYFLILFIWSFTVNKKKERTKCNNFFRTIFVETITMALFFLNVKVHLEGKEKMNVIPKGQRYLVVSNHLSNYDPMSVLSSLRKEKIVFISKPENFNIKMVGSLMHMSGFMAIDRDNVKNAMKTINKAADYIKSGESNIFIFPEGTRNRTEAPLLEFRNGAFKIATKAQCPIVVLALSETEKVKHNIPKRSHVYVKVVDVITADQVKEMKTADISEKAWHEIYDNITHGKKED